MGKELRKKLSFQNKSISTNSEVLPWHTVTLTTLNFLLIELMKFKVALPLPWGTIKMGFFRGDFLEIGIVWDKFSSIIHQLFSMEWNLLDEILEHPYLLCLN